MSYAGARPRRRPHIHLQSSTALTLLRGCSAAWVGVKTREDRLHGDLGVEGMGAEPITQHTTQKLGGPFCVESRGQLSVCLPVFALSAHWGR